MELFDTHCHFETDDRSKIAEILYRAAEAGVTRIMAVGGSALLNRSASIASEIASSSSVAASPQPPFPNPQLSTLNPQLSTLNPQPSTLNSQLPRVVVALGQDRDQIDDGVDLLSNIEWSRVAALGEIGLDYHYSPETREKQLALFARQLELAHKLNLPVVIHTREADDDTLALLREIPSHGIIHCFTGTPQFCRSLLDLGFMISFSGIVTFRAADNVRESALVVPDDRILVETDSPFLAPVPMRGKTNEPAFVVHTAKFLANLRSTPFEEFAALTTANAVRVLC